MPKHPGKKKQTNAEFQKAEFPARIAALRTKANSALAAGDRHDPILSTEERGRHQAALKAADRVEARMGTGKKKKATPKPAAPKSTPKTRRKVVERAVGQDKTNEAMEAVNQLAIEAAKNRG